MLVWSDETVAAEEVMTERKKPGITANMKDIASWRQLEQSETRMGALNYSSPTISVELQAFEDFWDFEILPPV